MPFKPAALTVLWFCVLWFVFAATAQNEPLSNCCVMFLVNVIFAQMFSSVLHQNINMLTIPTAVPACWNAGAGIIHNNSQFIQGNTYFFNSNTWKHTNWTLRLYNELIR